MTTYQELKAELLANPETLLLMASFLGATLHARRNKPGLLVEGILGAFSGLVVGVFGTIGVSWVMEYPLRVSWFFGFPIAYAANYLLGGMDTLGKQFAESPMAIAVSFLSTLADTLLEKITKLKSPKS